MDEGFYYKRLLLKDTQLDVCHCQSAATHFPFCLRLIAAVCVCVRDCSRVCLSRAAVSAVFVRFMFLVFLFLSVLSVGRVVAAPPLGFALAAAAAAAAAAVAL